MDAIVINELQIKALKKLIVKKLNTSLNRAYNSSYHDEETMYDIWTTELKGDDAILYYIFKQMDGKFSDFKLRLK